MNLKKLISQASSREALALASRKAARINEKPFDIALLPYINDKSVTGKTAVHQAAIALVEACTNAGQKKHLRTAVANLKCLLLNGGDLAAKDDDPKNPKGKTPLGILVGANSAEVIFELSKLTRDPALAKHPISRLKPLFLADLESVPGFEQIDKPDKWSSEMLVTAFDLFLANPILPVRVQDMGARGRGLVANEVIQPCQIVALFDGIVVDTVPARSLKFVAAYKDRKGLSMPAAVAAFGSAPKLLKSHGTEVGHIGATMLMLTMTAHELSAESPKGAGFINEGAPNAHGITVGNVFCMLALRPAPEGEELRFFYGTKHRLMQTLRHSPDYRLDSQSIQELIIYLIQTQHPGYCAMNKEICEAAGTAQAPGVAHTEMLVTLRSAYANALKLDDKTMPLIQFFIRHFPPGTRFKGAQDKFLKEVYQAHLVHTADLTKEALKYIKELAEQFILEHYSSKQPH